MRFDDYREEFTKILDRVTRFGDRVGQEAATLTRRISRLTRATFQGAANWFDDDRLFSDMKAVLDRAVKDMDAAWDAARERRAAERERSRESEEEAGSGE